MNPLIPVNRLFARTALSSQLAGGADEPPSEYAHLEGLVDLLDEYLQETDAEERGEIAALLERILGFHDLELVDEPAGDNVLHWVDARVMEERRVTIMLVEPHERLLDNNESPDARALGAQLVRRMEREEIPWAILGDGFRWRLLCRETPLPLLQTLDLDLTSAIQNADEPATVSILAFLSASAAAPGGLWDRLHEEEHRRRERESRLWREFIEADGRGDAALALWCEWSGVAKRTPLLNALTKNSLPAEETLRRALSRAIREAPFESVDPKARALPGAEWVRPATRLLSLLGTRPTASEALAGLRCLAGALDAHAGVSASLGKLPPSAKVREILAGTGSGSQPARVLLAGVPQLALAVEVLLAESSRRMIEGTRPEVGIPETISNLFAVDESEQTIAALGALVTCLCKLCGAEPPYLGHRLRVGNPHLSAAISSLGRAPALSRGAHREGGVRQLSFVEALFHDRLKTLASDLRLLSTAGPERIRTARQQEGVFRRLVRGVERFRDLADLWLLAYGAPDSLDSGTYESFVSDLKEQDPEWQARLKPLARPLKKLRENHAPFHWELEFPELYVEDGGSRIDPGFHLVLLAPPAGERKKLLKEWRAYHRSLSSDSPAPLSALASFGGLFRTSRGGLLIGPLSTRDYAALRKSYPESRGLPARKNGIGWIALSR
ncbi:MAG: hypothetical protein KDH09_02995 [Chrysiogenetes bacterium]|nr:hypothetical protein [Chrysiogenetes bacterium]